MFFHGRWHAAPSLLHSTGTEVPSRGGWKMFSHLPNLKKSVFSYPGSRYPLWIPSSPQGFPLLAVGFVGIPWKAWVCRGRLKVMFFAGYMINQRTFPGRCGNTLVETLCIGLRSPGCPPWRILVKLVRHNCYSFHISALEPWKVFRAKVLLYRFDGSLRAQLSVHYTTTAVSVAVI